MIRGTTTFSPSERAANFRMVVLLVAVGMEERQSCVRMVLMQKLRSVYIYT